MFFKVGWEAMRLHARIEDMSIWAQDSSAGNAYPISRSCKSYGIHCLLHARPLWLVLALISCLGMHARQLQRSLGVT